MQQTIWIVRDFRNVKQAEPDGLMLESYAWLRGLGDRSTRKFGSRMERAPTGIWLKLDGF